MIKFNNSDIIDWNFDDSNIIKVYHNGAVCYYKIITSGGTSGQTPCFAVVDDITQYSDTEFEDVFNQADEKWYKLNNLDAYEEYGVYGSGRNITTYNGKLTIDNGEDYSKYYLTLQALESGTIGFSAGTVDYSTDSGSTWNTLAQGDTISVSQGDNVMFKMSGATPNGNTGIGTFTSSCRFNVYGNIMSMQESDNFATATTIANYEFYFKRLFAESKAVSAENMVLPATTLRNFCYNELFKGSTYLTTPPKIFPATALTQDCYSFAFNGCTSLTKSPVLPALTAVRASYGWMFQDCTSLSEITCLATNTSAQYATYDWVKNVASSGTFYKNPNKSWSRGTSAIPSNWSAQDYVEPTPIKYEYIYSGGSWVNVGEVSGSSRLPQGYTEVEYIQNTTSAYLNLDVYPYNSSNNSYSIEAKISSTQGSKQFEYLFSCEQGNLSPYVGFVCRWQTTAPRGLLIDGTNKTSTGLTNNGDGTSAATITCNSTNATNTTPITLFCGLQGSTVWRNGKGKVYSFKVTINNTLVRDLVPCKRDSDSMVGMYDTVNDVFYYPPNYTSYQLVAGSPTSGGTEYPLYYDEIQDPPNNLTFSSMTEAESYECPWVGMHVTIDGDHYVFSGDSTSGYEWVEVVLPYDAEIEYLESSGSQYINTNQYLNTSNFEIGYSVLGNRGHWGYVHNNVVNGAFVTVDETTAFFGSWNNTDKVSVSSYISSTENTIVYTQSGATINGTTISKNLNLRGVDNLASVPLLFFALHDFYNNSLIYSNSKFKSFYLKNNDEYVVDMIPVRVEQIGYMYDKISGQLFGNAGTGSFILGPDK